MAKKIKRDTYKNAQQLTAPTSNFLRVNAQIRNLTYQKTASSCKTLATSLKDDTPTTNTAR